MPLYNFQLQTTHKSWENTPVKVMEFNDRIEAVTFAKRLSYFHDSEVRLSEGDFKTANGSYFNNCKLQPNNH